MKYKFIALKSLITLFLFILAIIFEGASQERLALLILLFSVLLAWGYLRPFLGNRFWYFIIDAFILYLLEYQSKFVINYFIHSLYILIILEAGLSLSRRYINYATVPISIISLVKFIYLLLYQLNARSISEFLFNLFALLFIITIINYTLLQREEREKNQLLYQELLQTHQKLKQYMNQSEQAAILEERQRIARDIHDTVGHQLTSLIMQLEMVNLHLNKGEKSEIIIGLLNKAKKNARLSLTETRKAVNALQGEETLGIKAVQNMLERIEEENGIRIQLVKKTNLGNVQLTPEESYILYRIIQESITNAIRHGHAEDIRVSLETNHHGQFVFTICNDHGKQVDFTEGFGMKNMRIRIEKLGGFIQFQSTDQEFKVSGSFPLKRTS